MHTSYLDTILKVMGYQAMVFGILALDSSLFGPEAGIAVTIFAGTITVVGDIYNLLKPSESSWQAELTKGWNR